MPYMLVRTSTHNRLLNVPRHMNVNFHGDKVKFYCNTAVFASAFSNAYLFVIAVASHIFTVSALALEKPIGNENSLYLKKHSAPMFQDFTQFQPDCRAGRFDTKKRVRFDFHAIQETKGSSDFTVNAQTPITTENVNKLLADISELELLERSQYIPRLF
ncbi:9964_t:CDS:2 [Ambispora gerdemannii]|uniref:9964_t:CDS:1 n=1 Tax=Ambispora gerdemannii TaxID=144530 RepID=A0A9N8Z3F2_9GLOM|nr:9964_t:CDS:2 [Ambispora gerdemannii]